MSYRNKTYVVFDGDNDIWAYGFMRGWKENQKIDFNFHDAHDLNTIRDGTLEVTVKKKLRERFASAKQLVVLIGDHTKHLYRFVRWEMEVALELDLPIIAVNLNKKRKYDPELCPPIIRDKYVVHVSFNMMIIKHALDNFPDEYMNRDKTVIGSSRYYSKEVYDKLGL